MHWLVCLSIKKIIRKNKMLVLLAIQLRMEPELNKKTLLHSSSNKWVDLMPKEVIKMKIRLTILK